MLEEAKGPEAQAAAAAGLAEKMRAVFGAAVQTEGPMKTLYDNLLAQAKSAADLAALAAGLPAKFTAAGRAAGGLTDPIAKALAKAHELGAQLDELARSEIELKFRRDPLGAARATALAEFDAAIGPAHPVDHAVRDEIAAERQAYADRAVEVARNRAEVARLNALEKEGGVALLKKMLEGALAAATGISNTDMAGAIREARREAEGLFAKLGPVLSRMRQMAQDRADWAAWMDPGRILRAGNDERGSQRGYVQDSQAYRYQESIANRPNSGGGAAAARAGLAGLQAEAQAALAALDVEIAAINEKVRAGLLSAAEGVDAVASAKRKAATAIAELIPQIEALGPKSKVVVEQLRKAMAGLVADLGAAGTTLGQQMADGFKAPFAAFIAGAKSGKAAFGDFMDFVNQKIASMLADRFTNAFITPLFNSIFGAFGLVRGGVVGAGGIDAAYAAGGMPGLSEYSNSVVTKPTLFPMAGGKTGLMGEAGPEAILPLRPAPGGGLGVLATGAEGKAGILPLQRSRGVLGVAAPDVRFATGGVPWRPAILDGPGIALTAPRRPSVPTEAPPYAAAMQAVAPPPDGKWVPRLEIINKAEGTKALRGPDRMEGGSPVMQIILEQIEGALAANLGRGVGPLNAVLGLQRQGR